MQCVFLQPAGRAVFIRIQKKQDKSWTEREITDKLTKWNESCWKMVVYTIFSTTAFLVTFWEPYFTDPRHYWTGATQFPLNYYVPFKMTLFYLIEIGFYIQAVPFLLFEEVRRKDWLESLVHHIVTLVLMYYSWYANFTRAGVMVMLLHDISDIFLEAAKLARYAEREDMATGLFATFALSWVILRVILFPIMVVSRIVIDPVVLIAVPYNINPQPHYAILSTLFMLLYFLHLYWTWLIWKVIERQLTKGGVDDVREEDD